MALKALGRFVEALATLRAGQRVDFDNRDLNKLITEIEPLLARAEQAKRAGMSQAELMKEQGNDAFKAAQFEKAIELYGEAIDACAKSDSAIAIACYNNRAACYQQLSNFSGVIADCTHVLEVDAANQKALLRRALAYEGLERYRLALQDIRALLAINPNIDVRPSCEMERFPGLTAVFSSSHVDAGRQQGSAPSRRVRAPAQGGELNRLDGNTFVRSCS